MSSSLSINYTSEIVWKVKQVADTLTALWAKKKHKQPFSLETIVKLINWAWANNEVADIVIEGKKGSGKTTLALMIAAYVYAKRGKPNWQKALDSLYFKPTQLLLSLIKRVSQGDKIKVVILDDAGAWISKWTITSEKEAFFEAFELSRTLVGGMIFTNVASLAKYLRMTSTLRIRVRRLSYQERVELAERIDNKVVKNSLLDRSMWWSEARVYTTSWDLRYREYIHKKAVFIYPVRMPNKIYRQYIEKRHEYTALKIVLALIRLAKANPHLLPEVLVRAAELEVLDIILPEMCHDRELKKYLKPLGYDCNAILKPKQNKVREVRLADIADG